jgi:hypothetical protein
MSVLVYIVSVYIMIMTLMAGVMLGLVVWSSRISTHRGIIKMPESHNDYIIGKNYSVVGYYLSCNLYNLYLYNVIRFMVE